MAWIIINISKYNINKYNKVVRMYFTKDIHQHNSSVPLTEYSQAVLLPL